MAYNGETASRDHLFISYAYEDEALAEWLALRLTSEGYRIWIDRFELLGGESYPVDIDHAIKRQYVSNDRTSFAFFSGQTESSEGTHSCTEYPTRACDEELLIILNVDNLRPGEMDWMTSDITFIPFSESWAAGLTQLLKKLARVDAPKQVADGRQIAANAYLPTDTLSHEPERSCTPTCCT